MLNFNIKLLKWCITWCCNCKKNLQLCYSTILYLWWYCNSIAKINYSFLFILLKTSSHFFCLPDSLLSLSLSLSLRAWISWSEWVLGWWVAAAWWVMGLGLSFSGGFGVWCGGSWVVVGHVWSRWVIVRLSVLGHVWLWCMLSVLDSGGWWVGGWERVREKEIREKSEIYFFIIFRGNCNKLTCGLASFNKTYPWFKSYHLTYMRCPPLDRRNPPHPFHR